ncbi:MAG: DUF1289 domain-containing protein [Rhodomicrobium sp.]|nr:DUF1289 domain-containing protein [Rhodomicrobium sp.]
MPGAPVPTPCIGVCEIDGASSLCLGCARTAEEVGEWLGASDDYKRRVWDALPERRARLGMTACRLPWLADECARFIETALRAHAGRWRVGIHGAAVCFDAGEEEAAEIESDADAVTVTTGRGALRLLKHEKIIAVAFGGFSDDVVLGQMAEPEPTRISSSAEADCQPNRPRLKGRGDKEPGAIGFVLPRGRVILQKADGLKALGPDLEAIQAERSHGFLYDTGLGQSLAARICLRTSNPQAAAILDAAQGRDFAETRQRLLAAEASGVCDLIVETGLGRAELFAASADVWPDPARLADRRELPPGWELKPVFALGALFYPGPA